MSEPLYWIKNLSCQNEMFKTRKKEIQKRLGPDGCEEPPDQSGSSKENPRNYNDQSNQQVYILNSPRGHNQCYSSFF